MDFALPKEALDAAATPDPTAAPVAPTPAPTAPPAPAVPLPGVPAPFTLPGSATAGGFQLPGDAEQAAVQDSAADDKFNPVDHYLKHGETPEAMDFAAKVAEYKAKHPDSKGKQTGGFLKGAWDEVANTGADIKDAFTGKLKTDPKSGLGSFAQGVAHATTVALQSIADTPKSVQVYNWSSEGQPAWIKRMGEKIAEHDRLLAVDQKEKDAFVKGGGKIQDYQSFIPEDAKVDAEDRADYDRVVGRQFEVAGILRSGALKGGENAIKAGRWAHGLFSGGDAALDTDDWKQRIAVDAELHKTADNIRQGKGSNAGAPGWIAPEPEVPDETRARLLREGQFTEKGIEQGSVVADPTNILAMEGLRLPIVSKATGAALKLTGKAAEFTGGIADKVLGHGAGKVLATGGGVLAGYEVTKRAVAGDLRPLGVALALLTARVALKRGGALMGEAGGELMNPEAFNSRAATAAAKAGEAEAAGAGPAALEEGSPMGQAVDNFFNPADNAAAASRVARRTIQGAGVGVTGAIPYAILSDNPEQAGHAVGGGVAFGGTLGPLGAGLENPTLNRAMEINKAATRILADRGAATTFEDPALQKAHNEGVKDLSYSTRTYFDALKGLLSGFKSKAGNPMNIAVLNAPDYAAQLAKRAPGADPTAAAKSRAFYDSATGTILVNKGEGPNGLRVDSAGHETGHFITDEVMGQMGRAYGDAMRNAVEGGLFDGNAPTPEFQAFIDDYNSKTPGTKIPSGKSVHPGDILRHRAVSEYLAETTRNILGDPTPGKFILPKDVSDKMADKMVRMYGDAAGAKQDIFSRTDLPTIHAALADVIFDLGRGMKPQQRRAGSPRRPTGEAVTPQDGSAPSPESGAAPREPGAAGEPQNPAMPENPAPAEPFSDIGLTTEQVDAARDFHVNFPGMEPGPQRANKKKGLPAKSKDARATELGAEWDDAFDKYAEYLRTNGLKAPKDPQTFHQAVIDFYLKSDAGANPNIERPGGTPPPTDSTGPQKPASSIESKTAILEQPEPGKAPEGEPEPGALEPQPLNEDTIRQRMTEAENKVVQSPEFAKKRSEKTRAAMQKEARVRAALEAAHEASADNPDALRKVTDEDGVTSYKGRLDPETIPAHKILLDEMGITEDGQAAISLLDDQVGKTVYLDYKSAPKTDAADVTGAQRTEEQAASTPDARRAGGPSVEQKGKAFHVLGFKVFPKKGSVTLFGFSPDKWIANVGKLVEHLKAEGQPTGYNGVNDALLAKDMEAVVENHKHGWKGDGSAPVAGATIDEGYTPQSIPPERFHVLNASLKSEISTKRGSDSAATESGALAAQERAIDNGIDIDAETGDVNPLRAFINKSGKLISSNAAGKVREGTADHLETVLENIAPDLVTGLSDTPGGRQIVRPVGYKGDPGFPVRKGIPRGDYTASGFMPNELKAADEAARKAGYTIRAAHSTNAGDFHEFKTGGLSTHFGTEKAALDRAAQLREFSEDVAGRKHDEARVMPVWLKIENPLRLPDLADLAMDERGRIVPIEEAREAWLDKLTPTDRDAWENPDNYEGDPRGDILDEYGDEPGVMAWESETDFAEVLRDKGIITTDEFWDVQYDKDAAVALLKEKGYDGIEYKNNVEGGGDDSYIVFDPNQIKSADEITKDSSGKEIPLADRFDSSKPDIRFMPNGENPKLDEFLKDSVAVNERGEPMVMYHGSPSADKVTEFKSDSGLIFVSPDKQYAARFTGRGSGDGGRTAKKVIPLYASIKNPIDIRQAGENPFLRAQYTKEGLGDLLKSHGLDVPLNDLKGDKHGPNEWLSGKYPEIKKQGHALGYDGLIQSEANLLGGDGWAVFDSSQLKHVKENSGAFDKGNPDIRFMPNEGKGALEGAEPVKPGEDGILSSSIKSKMPVKAPVDWMPAEGKVRAASIRLKDGEVIDAPSHSFAYDKANEQGKSLAGVEEGFTLKDGAFIHRDEAYRRFGGSTTEDFKPKKPVKQSIGDDDLLAALREPEFMPKEDSFEGLAKKYKAKFGEDVPSGWSRADMRRELGVPEPVKRAPKAETDEAAAEKKRGALEEATPKRDVIGELKKEGVLNSDDIPEDMPKSSQAYFELGHNDPNGKNWIYYAASGTVKSKTGGTHGINWGHDVADRSFKGWYDTERNVISVAFPESARRKIAGEPTVDDIPTGVYNKLKAKFGKDAAMVAFMPDENASSIKSKREEKDGFPVFSQPGKPAIRTPDGGVIGEGYFMPSAFHGTPHKFDKFSLEKMGSGEGAQAFGWGLYFAENRRVAEDYRKKLSDYNTPGEYKYNGEVYQSDDYTNPVRHALALAFHQGKATAISIAKQGLKDAAKGEPYAVESGGEPYYKNMLAAAQGIKSVKQIKFEQGHTYEVDLDVSDSQVLHYDKPLAEQAKPVQDVARDILKKEKYLGADDDGPRQLTSAWRAYLQEHGGMSSKDSGEAVYDAVAKQEGGEKEASLFLNDKGIHGIKYADEGSRTKRSGKTHNYVIFDDSKITVTGRNGEPVKLADAMPGEAQDAGAFMPSEEGDSLKVYHGTPNKIVGPFDLSKIGTGEGSQAYGHGIYFADQKDVALSYWPRESDMEKKLMAEYKAAEGRNDYDSMELWEAAMLHELPDSIKGEKYEHVDETKRTRVAKRLTAILKAAKGGIYKVHMDVKPTELLDWDKPLAEQPEGVKQSLRKALLSDGWQNFLKAVDAYDAGDEKAMKSEGYNVFDYPGAAGGIYQTLAGALGPRKASALLAKYGIPGIKFLDERSRDAGAKDQSRNYVIFDTSKLKVIGRNGILESPKPGESFMPGESDGGGALSKPVSPVRARAGRGALEPDDEDETVSGHAHARK